MENDIAHTIHGKDREFTHLGMDIPADVIESLKMMLGSNLHMISAGDLQQAHLNFLANGDILREHDGHDLRDQLHLHIGEENDGHYDHFGHESHSQPVMATWQVQAPGWFGEDAQQEKELDDGYEKFVQSVANNWHTQKDSIFAML